MATRVFPVKNKHKLDNPWRRQVLPPKETLLKLGLTPSDIVLDVGCGIGYFTFSAAQIVGPDNKVYALDLSQDMLDVLRANADESLASCITTVKTDTYDMKLLDEVASFALVVTVLHEVEDPKRFIQEVHRILKPGGRIAIVDFEAKETQYGPPLAHRIQNSVCRELVEDSGFEITDYLSFDATFYGIVAVKNN
ncbi:hypothetical protein P9112_003294 [Eukaryota sp. TZLM1-RC]